MKVRAILAPWPGVSHLLPFISFAHRLKTKGISPVFLAPNYFKPLIESYGFEYCQAYELENANTVDDLKFKSEMARHHFQTSQFMDWYDQGGFTKLLKKINPTYCYYDSLYPIFNHSGDNKHIEFVEVHTTFPLKETLLVNVKALFYSISGFRYFFSEIKKRSLNNHSKKSLIMVPKSLARPSELQNKNCEFMDLPITPLKAPINFPFERLDAKRKLVICSLGRDTRLSSNLRATYRKLLHTFAKLKKFQFVLAVHHKLYAETLQAKYPAAIVVDTMPQVELLKRTSLMIHHAGMGSIRECLEHGVPMLMIPQRWDQPDNAERVVEIGKGLILADFDHTPREFSQRWKKLLNRF